MNWWIVIPALLVIATCWAVALCQALADNEADQ